MQRLTIVFVFICITLTGCSRTPKSQAHYRVMSMLKTGEYEAALQDVDRRLQREPHKRALLEDRLILLLANENPQSRVEILKVQRQLDAFGEGRQLLLEQSSSTLPRIRQQTAFALGELRESSSMEVLKDLAEDNDPEVRAEAIHALGKLARPEAKNILMIRLRDGYWKVRAEAADALASIGDTTASAQLFRAADDHDDYARMHILGSLLTLAHTNETPLYFQQIASDNLARKTAAALVLGKLGRQEALPVLIELLQDKNNPERVQIAQILIGLRPVSAGGSLESFLKNEQNPRVKALLMDYLQRKTNGV